MRTGHWLKAALLLCCIFPLLGSSCLQQQNSPQPDELLAPFPDYGAAPMVRVMLTAPSKAEKSTLDAGQAVVWIDGRRTTASGKLALGRSGGRVSVEGVGSGRSIEITPEASPEFFTIDDRVYRGRLRLVATDGGWEVINVVDLEQYIAGVIGWEMLRNWPVEALKAQAVASRTYALFVMNERKGSGSNWDLDDSTRFQVYGGVGPAGQPSLWRESANVLAAREATTGQVMTWRGKGFKAFFHSTSGGRTTSPSVAFGGNVATIEPLGGADLGEFGKESPRFDWRVEMDQSEVHARLIEAGIRIDDLLRVEVSERAESGHAIVLKLYRRDGKAETVSAVAFRSALGLSSTNFTAERDGLDWVFEGHGFGHGCGMCQWSAKGMAGSGWEYDRILKTMYPGARVETIY